MKNYRYFLVITLTFLVSACASSGIKPATYIHASYGDVTVKHPEFVKVRTTCGNAAYAQGITMIGKKITNRDEATRIWSRDIVNMNIGAGAHLYAQSKGGILVGKPGHQTYEPSYSEALRTLEKKTWACVKEQGFSRKEDT